MADGKEQRVAPLERVEVWRWYSAVRLVMSLISVALLVWLVCWAVRGGV